MGESFHAPDWKIPFGSIEQILDFKQNGSIYLQKFDELFYRSFKMSQMLKEGHRNDTLTKNLLNSFSDCRKSMRYYMLGVVFFIDIDPQVTLASLNRINNVITELKDPNLIITSGFVQIFLGFVSDKLGRTLSSSLAFNSAVKIFPRNSIFYHLAQKQIIGERTFKEWVADCLNYFEIQDRTFLTDLYRVADSINIEEYQIDYPDEDQKITTQEYEKKFLEKYSEKEKMKTHVRRCPNCNYFMISDDKDEKLCPQCHKKMNFTLYCPLCGIWYTVKTHKKYMCPTCGTLMIKRKSI